MANRSARAAIALDLPVVEAHVDPAGVSDAPDLLEWLSRQADPRFRAAAVRGVFANSLSRISPARSAPPRFEGGEAAPGLLQGESLRARLERETRLSPQVAVALFLPIVGAIRAAPENGIIHRDIKPENVMLD